MSRAQTDVPEGIRACDDEFEQGIRSRSASRLIKLVYAEDAVVLPWEQPTVSGRAEIAEFWQGMFRIGLREAALFAERVEASGDVAVETGRLTLTIRPVGAESTEERSGHLGVYQRQADGSWKVVSQAFGRDPR